MHMMASQKQSLPSFASILSVLSIVFYCAGFLRVELELNEQKKRINALESTEETKLSDVPNSLHLLTLMFVIFARALQFRIDGTKGMSRGVSGRLQVINFANTSNWGRLCLFLFKTKRRFLNHK